MLLVTLIALLLIALCAVATAMLELARVFWHEDTFFGKSQRRKYPVRVWVSLLAIVIVGVMAVPVSVAVADALQALTFSWMMPFLAIGGATGWMLYRERIFLRNKEPGG